MSGDRSGTAPSRRTLLTGAALLAGTAITAVTSGCTGSSRARSGSSARPRPISPDERAAGRAVLAARSLLAAEAELADLPRLRPLIATIAASHRAHLTALGMPDPTVSPSGSESLPGSPAEPGSPSGRPSASPAGSPTRPSPGTTPASPSSGAAAAAVSRELAAAREALADVLPTTPATAGLLARIAAARAVHADLLAAVAGLPAPAEPSAPPEPAAVGSPDASPASPTSPTSPASPTGSPLDDGSAAALSALLAGEHAAVFAYGLITARAVPARAASARALWVAHRARRDELERRLLAAGRTPVASLPAYDVGRLPTTPAQLAALAANVENGLAAVALGAVTGSKGALRSEAAADLVRAARRAAIWRGAVDPLPGTPS